MSIHKINYDVKSTRSNNTYIQISGTDHNLFMMNILSINSYMQELCLTNDPIIKPFINWWRSPDKKYPYNKRLGKRNTPETMIAGLINNILFGNQEDLSLEQLPFYEEIVNNCVEIIEEYSVTTGIKLQTKPLMTKIQFGIGMF